MTDADEKAAMAWLDSFIRLNDGLSHNWFARTLKRMLAEPRLPKEPTPEMLLTMATGWKDDYRGAYRALYAHLTAPKPLIVRMTWGAQGFRGDAEKALDFARAALKNGEKVTIEPEGT